jgi:sulfatase maturation enzyme AslB (radical SAM superfamily)
VTMAGKPCKFKAVCGNYCRKHKVSDVGMGKKVDVNSLLSQLDGIKISS